MFSIAINLYIWNYFFNARTLSILEAVKENKAFVLLNVLNNYYVTYHLRFIARPLNVNGLYTIYT